MKDMQGGFCYIDTDSIRKEVVSHDIRVMYPPHRTVKDLIGWQILNSTYGMQSRKLEYMLREKLSIYSEEETESLRCAVINAKNELMDDHCHACYMLCNKCPVRHLCRDLGLLADYLSGVVASYKRQCAINNIRDFVNGIRLWL